MKSSEFLFKYKESAEQIDTDIMLSNMLDEMQLGLTKAGEGSIPMIPSYLAPTEEIIYNKRSLLIDAGGTNFRSAVGYFNEEGRVVIEDMVKCKMPASDTTLTKDEFYNQVAKNISHAINSDNVGFCFSYNVAMQPNIDGTVVCFSKEINASEVIGTKVGECTLSALAKYSDKPRKIAILNDTVATLLGGMANYFGQYSAFVGYIYGTGTNISYIERNENILKNRGLPNGRMIINTEAGGFDRLPRGLFDERVDNASKHPNTQRLEKMTSGKYLSDVIYQAFLQAKEDEEFCADTSIVEFSLAEVSKFLNGELSILDNFFVDARDVEFAKDICVGLIDRAGKIGAVLNSSAVIRSDKVNSLPVAIVAEGTTFNKLVGYRKSFEKYLSAILSNKGIKYEIIQGEDLNMVGTLMATMVL